MTLVFTLNDYEKIGEIGYEGVKNCLNVTGLIQSAHHLITNGHTAPGAGGLTWDGAFVQKGTNKKYKCFKFMQNLNDCFYFTSGYTTLKTQEPGALHFNRDIK